MARGLALAAASLVACAPPPSTPVATPIPVAPPPTAPSKPAVVATACLPKVTLRAPLAHVSETDGALVACFLDQHLSPKPGSDYPCLTIRADGTFAAAPRWKAPPSPELSRYALPPPNPGYELVPKGKSIDVCSKGSKRCRTVKVGWTHPKGIGHGNEPNDAPIGAVSDDGKRLFVYAAEPVKPDAKKNALEFRVHGETWDIDGGKRLSRVTLFDPKLPNQRLERPVADDTAIWSASWVGERVLASGHGANGPDASVELLDPKTGAGIQLGDAMHFARVRDDRYLVGTVRYGQSPALTLLDVNEARVLATFELDAGSLDFQEAYALDYWLRGDGTAHVVYAHPPSIVTVDASTATMGKPRPLPLCD